MGLEDKGKTEILYASLPLGRARIVRARYLLTVLLTAAAAGLCFGALALIARISPIGGQRAAAGALLVPEALVLFPAALLLLFSYYLPFVFGLGFGRGSGFAAGILAAAAALGTALAPGAVGRWFASRAPGSGLVPDPVGSILRAAAGMRESWGTPAFMAAAAALTALILWLSIGISTALYKRRDL
jgi:ABC-type transport system involved in multi-copper enzyme maturation permease subunit